MTPGGWSVGGGQIDQQSPLPIILNYPSLHSLPAAMGGEAEVCALLCVAITIWWLPVFQVEDEHTFYTCLGSKPVQWQSVLCVFGAHWDLWREVTHLYLYDGLTVLWPSSCLLNML